MWLLFPLNVQTIAKINKPNSLTQSRDFRVCKSKGLGGLTWLVQNSPVYSDITINKERIESLPENVELLLSNSREEETVCEKSGSKTFETPVDLGPTIECEIRSKELSSFLTIVKSTPKLQNKWVNKFLNSVELNIIGDQSINEFKTQYLATKAFHTFSWWERWSN